MMLTSDILENTGICDNYYLEQILELENTYYLHWTGYNNNASNIWYCVFKDGVYLGQTTDTKLLIKMAKNTFSDFRIFPLSEKDAKDLVSSTQIASIPSRGNRLKLNWNKIDLTSYPDFYSYMLYWSSDNTNFTVLTEIVGVNENQFITDRLVDSEWYYFKLEYKDFLGNISNNNIHYSGTVQDRPLPVDNQVITYSGKKINITANKPSGQYPDIAYYGIWNNYNPQVGLQNNNITIEPAYKFWPNETISYQSNELFSGVWHWTVLAVDTAGFTSTGTVVDFNIDISGNLITAKPFAPYSVSVIPSYSGYAKAIIEYDKNYSGVPSGSGIDYTGYQIHCGLNNIHNTLTWVAGKKRYETMFSGLIDMQTYTISGYTSCSGVNSDIVFGNSFIADTTSPDGDSILNITMIEG